MLTPDTALILMAVSFIVGLVIGKAWGGLRPSDREADRRIRDLQRQVNDLMDMVLMASQAEGERMREEET